MLTAFVELERITHELTLSVLLGDDSQSQAQMSLTWAGYVLVVSGAMCLSMARIECVPEINRVFACCVAVIAIFSGIGLVAISRRDRQK